MSLLNVENLSHTFGDRTLFKDVSFRLLAEDHVGLVGANGVGKSTLMNIITGQLIHIAAVLNGHLEFITAIWISILY
jgi:ATPase subunit of ABC transporter with duplicated ATPase domains